MKENTTKEQKQSKENDSKNVNQWQKISKRDIRHKRRTLLKGNSSKG